MRGDIADIRLAEFVFAPHYAAPMERTLAIDAPLCGARDEGVEPIASLKAGDRFDILDIAGRTAWGIAVAQGLVGYVAIAAIADLAP